MLSNRNLSSHLIGNKVRAKIKVRIQRPLVFAEIFAHELKPIHKI